MLVKDLETWTQQLLELDIDETSRKFKDFLLFWVDASEKIYEEIIPGKLGGFRKYSAHDALSKGLEVTEQTMGFIGVEWLGQMLVVLVQHWQMGGELWDGLTFFEKRMYEQALAMKLTELQQLAAERGQEDVPVSEGSGELETGTEEDSETL